jgi:hypothetical protein
MRRWSRAAGTVCGALLVILCVPAALAAAPCDEFNPVGPWRDARITLGSSDFVDESRDEMRSFVMTGSVGSVTAAIVSSNPHGIVRAVSAVPQVSRLAEHEGEQLKGIAVTVLLSRSARPATVVINVRQVCAQYFRNTFLYY